MPSLKYTKEILEPLAKKCMTFSDMARVLKPDQRFHTGLVSHIHRQLHRYGIDHSHMLGKAYLRGTSSPKRIPAWKRLVLRPPGSRREHYHVLKGCLDEIGRPYRCATCGIGPKWNGFPLTLQVDHRNGKVYDDRPMNLRYQCPNCHSQTPTYKFNGRSHS